VDEVAATDALRLGRVALALSGGGSRAIAFHLGCLRALKDAGILDKVEVISSVSGGSVVAALYCSHPGDFASFERRTRELLEKGFLVPALVTVVTTTEGIRALVIFSALLIDRFLAFLARLATFPFRAGTGRWRWLKASAIVRSASRTTILRRTFSRLFGQKLLSELRPDRPQLVVVACELRAKAAFYFTAKRLHCWRYGSASSDGVEVADAISASAAYPLMLPAIDRQMVFEKNGRTRLRRISLTDGGVYDNLGLAPLWPDRDFSISMDVGRFDRIIACRAGYALEVSDPASLILPRMAAAFESIFARSQNQAMKRLYDLTEVGKLKGFLLPYLGQNDGTLRCPPADLIPCEEVAGYPTNFSAMPPEWIDRLARRGVQLVEALLAENWANVQIEEPTGAPDEVGQPGSHDIAAPTRCAPPSGHSSRTS